LLMTLFMKKSSQKLFISGPVNLDDNIRESIYNSPDIGHRELEFVELLKGIREKLLIVFKANKEEYSVLIFTGSGTSAMEAVMAANVHEGKKALRNLLKITSSFTVEQSYNSNHHGMCHV